MPQPPPRWRGPLDCDTLGEMRWRQVIRMRRWDRLSLRAKVATFTALLVTFAFGTGLLVTGYYLFEAMVGELGRRAMAVARTVAQVEVVRQHLGAPDGATAIQPVVERMRVSTQVEYIVTFDMNRIRYSSPLAERIGQPFQGGDEGPALSQQAYVSRAVGVNGRAVRAFAPVLSPDGSRQVGVVVVGIMLPRPLTLLSQFSFPATLGLSGGLVIAAFGSWLLAIQVKRQMFNLEPPEIAHILEERVALITALSDGLIAIDQHGTITVMNDEAMRLIGVGPDAIGRNLDEVIPSSPLLEVVRTGRPQYNQQSLVGRRLVLANRVPVLIDGCIVGALSTFRERTEVHRLAEELTGVTRFVEGLRAQNHESLNKLHTIAGLIHMKQYQQALEYIYAATEQQEEESRFLIRYIRDYQVSGLLLGKVIRGRELGITLMIDRSSRLTGIPAPLDNSDLVLILGNLLENAMEALEGQTGDREVDCLLQSDKESLRIRVTDNGPGVPEDLREAIFRQGVSTKGEHRGLGLAMVTQLTTLAGGRLSLTSEPGRTTFAIEIEGGDSGAANPGNDRG